MARYFFFACPKKEVPKKKGPPLPTFLQRKVGRHKRRNQLIKREPNFAGAGACLFKAKLILKIMDIRATCPEG
jgi:hypothetical protein